MDLAGNSRLPVASVFVARCILRFVNLRVAVSRDQLRLDNWSSVNSFEDPVVITLRELTIVRQRRFRAGYCFHDACE